MLSYFLKRLILIIPTLFAIMVINFTLVQFAPGGPIEQIISKLNGHNTPIASQIGVSGSDFGAGGGNQTNQQALKASSASISQKYAGAQGLDPEFIASLEEEFGFDKPLITRFILMIKKYLVLDFGESYFKGGTVTDLILKKMPVSISLGLWTTFFVYLISIPLGIRKALQDGSSFDLWTSTIVIIGYAVPSFLFAIILIVLFAGGEYLDLFPLRGLVSENWASLSVFGKIFDYLWHMTLPILAMVIGGFASLVMLTKNSFMEEIRKQYTLTARAKGCQENKILYGHIFRNAMLIVIAGFPSAFVSILFTGALLIEVIFSLDGLGLLGFEAALTRDYPIMFGTLFIFTLLGLVLNIIGDLTYMLVDPRIDFEKRDA